jgi:hypothetical protein
LFSFTFSGFSSFAFSKNGHHFVFVTLFFMKGSNMCKIKTKSEFMNGQHHVSINCTESFDKLNASFLLPAFFNSAVQV